MKFKYFLTSFLVLGLTACGSSDDEPVGDPLGLNGSWISNCYLGNFSESIIDTFDYSGLNFSSTSKVYPNSTCSGSPKSTDAVTGKIEIGNEITTGSGLTATEVKFTFELRGSTLEVHDIISLTGDEYLFGVFDTGEVYPTELDFDIILSRQ